MSSTGQYSLNWPEHENNRTSAFKTLKETQQFVDVTLVCDDDEQIEAHRVILSAASPFFQNILQRNPHSHPLLYIRGSGKENLSALLDFIYSGEVKVPMEELEAFMALAKDLKVNGLVEVPEKPIKQEQDMKPSVDNIKRAPSSSRKPKKVAFNVAEDENWLKNYHSVEPEVIVENDSSDLSDENLL